MHETVESLPVISQNGEFVDRGTDTFYKLV